MKMMNCYLTVWHFSHMLSVGWCCRLASISKQLIFFGTALRILPGGGLVSVGREEHIDWYFVVRQRLIWNQMYWQLVSKRPEKWHFKQLRHINIKPGFLKALFLRECGLMNKDTIRESFFFPMKALLMPSCLDRYFCLVNNTTFPAP